MHTITLSYSVFALFCVLFVLAVGAACTLAACLRVSRQTSARLGAAYAELTKGAQRREADLLSERNIWSGRAAVAEADADRMAPALAQFVKDIDDTAALLKDDKPPALSAEREALLGHQTALVFRTNEIQIPHDRSHEKADAARAICADAAPRR